MTYQEKKEAAREEAKQWQRDFPESSHSYEELAEAYDHFESLGRRFGLLEEFRENGIL